MKALVESAGKVASRARLGRHELIFDQPPPVPGGDDLGPSPLDVLAVSIAACAHYYAAAFLYGRGLPTEGLAVEVEAEKERAPTPRIARFSMKVRLPPGLSERQLIGASHQELPCVWNASPPADGRADNRGRRRGDRRAALCVKKDSRRATVDRIRVARRKCAFAAGRTRFPGWNDRCS